MEYYSRPIVGYNAITEHPWMTTLHFLSDFHYFQMVLKAIFKQLWMQSFAWLGLEVVGISDILKFKNGLVISMTKLDSICLHIHAMTAIPGCSTLYTLIFYIHEICETRKQCWTGSSDIQSNCQTRATTNLDTHILSNYHTLLKPHMNNSLWCFSH